MGILEDVLGIGIILVVTYVGWNMLSSGTKLGGPSSAVAPTGGGMVQTIGKDKSGNDMINPTSGKEWHSGQDWPAMYFPPTGDPKIGRAGAILNVRGSSPRLTVGGGWGSTEITFWTKGKFDWLAIHGGSDHHNKKGTNKGKWGGYAMKIYQGKSDAGVQKEPIHGTYCRAKAKGSQGSSYTVGSGWVGWKGIQRTEGDSVILEAYINEGSGWKTLFKEVDNGNFPCDKKPHTEGGEMIWLRFNGATGNIQVKNLSVREIGGGGRAVPKQAALARAYYAYYYPKIPISLSS